MLRKNSANQKQTSIKSTLTALLASTKPKLI